MEQAGSQAATAMGSPRTCAVLKSLVLEHRTGQGAILGFRVHMGSVTDRDIDRVRSRDRGCLLGNSTLQSVGARKLGLAKQISLGHRSPDSTWAICIDPALSCMYSMGFPLACPVPYT